MPLSAGVIDSLDSGVIVLGADGRVSLWNNWLASRSGIAASAADGRPLDEIFPSLRNSHLLAAVGRALSHGLPTVMSHNLHPRVLPLFTRYGDRSDPVEQSVVVRPLTSADGERGCLIQVTDITAAVRRDRHLRDVTVYNRTLFEMAVDPMATVAADGMLIDANPAFAEVAGGGRATLAGSSFPALFTKPAEAERLIQSALQDGRASDVLLSIEHGDGSARHLSFAAATVLSRREDCREVFLVARDLTERIESARELAQKNLLVERSNAELEQFAYVVSHDLRQPLRTIASYLTLIQHHLDASSDTDVKDFLGFAVDGAKRMDRLIVGLLNYARVGRQDAAPEPVGLNQVVAEARANLAGAIAEAGAAIDCVPTLPVVRGWGDELVRVFQNLMANAIAYAAPGRPPKVEIDCRDDGEMWRITVRDNGIGIAADDLERVFTLFHRLNTTAPAEGSGIGLAVCRKIIDRHRGRIWAEPIAAGTGTAFVITLPKNS